MGSPHPHAGFVHRSVARANPPESVFPHHGQRVEASRAMRRHPRTGSESITPAASTPGSVRMRASAVSKQGRGLRGRRIAAPRQGHLQREHVPGIEAGVGALDGGDFPGFYSVVGGPLDVVDYQHVLLGTGRLEFQSKLFPQCREY